MLLVFIRHIYIVGYERWSDWSVGDISSSVGNFSRRLCEIKY